MNQKNELSHLELKEYIEGLSKNSKRNANAVNIFARDIPNSPEMNDKKNKEKEKYFNYEEGKKIEENKDNIKEFNLI